MSKSKTDTALTIVNQVVSLLGPVLKFFLEEQANLKGKKSAGSELSGKEWAKNDADFDEVVGDIKNLLGPEEEE